MKVSRPNQLIQDLCRDPEGMRRIRENLESCLEEYGLDEHEKAALRSGDPMRVVSEAGVHPILGIHYLFAINPDAMAQMSIRHYPQLLSEN